MRVGLVVYGSLDVLSGGNLYDSKLVERLSSHGHVVDIASLPLRSYPLALLQNLSPSLERRLSNGALDVVLEDELAHPSLFRRNRALRRKLACPIVAIVHHLRSSEDRPGWQNDLYRRVEKEYLRSVDAFVFNSHTTRESVEALLQKKTRNVVATPGGDRLGASMDVPGIGARAGEPGALRLLFVGNLIPRKGLHDLLQALEALREQSWRLDVVGSPDMNGAYARGLRNQVERSGLGDRITFHGSLNGESLARRFREAQLLVVPSSYEGFGIVYLEAMGFGLPVIAGAAGAADEIVRHEGNGFLVHPGDTFSLSRQLERLMEDRELLARLSVAAYESFRDHPTWDESMAAIESFLAELR